MGTDKIDISMGFGATFIVEVDRDTPIMPARYKGFD
jgi:hypothetical protein